MIVKFYYDVIQGLKAFFIQETPKKKIYKKFVDEYKFKTKLKK